MKLTNQFVLCLIVIGFVADSSVAGKKRFKKIKNVAGIGAGVGAGVIIGSALSRTPSVGAPSFKKVLKDRNGGKSLKDSTSTNLIGSEVVGEFLSNYANKKYRAFIAKELDLMSPTNELRMTEIYRVPPADQMNLKFSDIDFKSMNQITDFAKLQNLKVHGGNLIDGQRFQVPSWVIANNRSSDQIKSIINAFVIKVIQNYKDTVAYWNVFANVFNDNGQLMGGSTCQPSSTTTSTPSTTNSTTNSTAAPSTTDSSSRCANVLRPTDDKLWSRISLDQEWVVNMYKAAREAVNSNVKLFISESNLDSSTKLSALLQLVKTLRSTQVKSADGKTMPIIDGISIELSVEAENSESSQPSINFSYIKQAMKTIADENFDIFLNRVNFRLKGSSSKNNSPRQRKGYYDIATLCRENKKCRGIILSGFTDALSNDDAATSGNMLDKDYKYKHAYWGLKEGLAGFEYLKGPYPSIRSSASSLQQNLFLYSTLIGLVIMFIGQQRIFSL